MAVIHGNLDPLLVGALGLLNPTHLGKGGAEAGPPVSLIRGLSKVPLENLDTLLANADVQEFYGQPKEHTKITRAAFQHGAHRRGSGGIRHQVEPYTRS